MSDPFITAPLMERSTERRLVQAGFWVVLIAVAGLGLLGGWGRGPGLLLGAILVAAYALVRHRHIPAPWYVLLTLGLIGAAGLWLVVPLYFLS